MSCHSRDAAFALLTRFRQTRRPRLLLGSARIGQIDYVRERDLKRILRLPAPPPPGPQTLALLIDLEAEQERLRTRPMAETGVPWRAARHVEVLIALLAEARLLLEAMPQSAAEGLAAPPRAVPQPG